MQSSSTYLLSNGAAAGYQHRGITLYNAGLDWGIASRLLSGLIVATTRNLSYLPIMHSNIAPAS